MADVIAGKRSKLSDQVAMTIRQRIRMGQYKPGDSLPPVRTMSKEFGVSLNVIQRALLALENDNVVVSHPGRSIEICQTDPCADTAIIFGLIIPYDASMTFASQITMHAEQVFGQRHNFVVLRSSEDDPEREKQVAQHLINNGVQGLLVWPTSDDPNAAFFAELAEQVPVVFIDRRLDDSQLPCVVEDYHSCALDMM
ncbi:MAG: GntR family transcriptional regulator, partial [Phycisphaeraceae bacterium JB051]